MYSVGDLVKLTATFTDAANALEDPTAVAFTVYAPNGATSTPVVTRVSTGVYTALVSATQEGDWEWRAVGTGAVQAAKRGEFHVEP